jgi:hypothetical protein
VDYFFLIFIVFIIPVSFLVGLGFLIKFLTVKGIIKPYAQRKGNKGESRVFSAIEAAGLADYAVRNLYLLKNDGTTTEIDSLVICSKGIIVFEVKNYGGRVYGHTNKKQWKQYFPRSPRMFPLLNPLWQNYGHIQTVKEILCDKPDIRYISVILFADDCVLKITKHNIDPLHTIISHIGYTRTILKSITEGHYPDCLTSELMDEVRDALIKRQATEVQKSLHIEYVNAKKSDVTY